MPKKKIIGYKAFEEDLTCRDFQYEIGKIYTYKGKIEVCKSGFHFCKSVNNCYDFYPVSKNTRICKVEALGCVETNDNIKFVTDKIKILSEVKNPLKKTNLVNNTLGHFNIGEFNTGNCNTGNKNIGHWNTGNSNIGSYNTGNCNIGNNNTGVENPGNCNTGNYNHGDYNVGHHNMGSRNIGDWNQGDLNIGIFNTSHNIDCKIQLFNKPSDWTLEDWRISDAYIILQECPISHSEFIKKDAMTEKEKKDHPEYKKLGGYTKYIEINQKDVQKWWDELPEEYKKKVISLPNFDADIFYQCTGIRVNEEIK